MTVATSDIEAVLGRSLTVAELTRVERLTEMAEGQVESQIPGFSIDTGLVEDEVIPYTDLNVMWTARWPVSEVTSLSIDGTEQDTDTYRWNEKGKIELGRWTSLDDFEINLTVPRWSEVLVSYAYGLTPVPAGLAQDVAGFVATRLQGQATNPNGLQSWSLGAASYSFFEGAGSAQPASVQALVRTWRRYGALSVPLVR